MSETKTAAEYAADAREAFDAERPSANDVSIARLLCAVEALAAKRKPSAEVAQLRADLARMTDERNVWRSKSTDDANRDATIDALRRALDRAKQEMIDQRIDMQLKLDHANGIARKATEALATARREALREAAGTCEANKGGTPLGCGSLIRALIDAPAPAARAALAATKEKSDAE